MQKIAFPKEESVDVLCLSAGLMEELVMSSANEHHGGLMDYLTPGVKIRFGGFDRHPASLQKYWNSPLPFLQGGRLIIPPLLVLNAGMQIG